MDDVLNSRQGDCKDQAGLMIALLREMGIPAHFALVNARYVNTVGFLPSTRFTHAVVRTRASDGTEYWCSQWKNLGTTNQIERLNEEFRRRTKTQGSFTHEASALVVLWGLVAFGHVGLRKIDGWQELSKIKSSLKDAA